MGPICSLLRAIAAAAAAAVATVATTTTTTTTTAPVINCDDTTRQYRRDVATTLPAQQRSVKLVIASTTYRLVGCC